MRPIASLTLACLVTATATAQSTVVIPNGTSTVAGNFANAFPWGSSVAQWPGLRLMSIYDAANFTNQGITSPILITALRWRPNDGEPAWTGGTFTQATVELSTAPMNYTLATTNYPGNHGPDRTVVHSGPVVHAGGNGGFGGIPVPWSVVVPLATQFVYDPAAGDLVIDVDYPGGANFVGGTLPQMDVHAAGSQACRIFASSMYPSANGMTQDHGVVVEISYVPGAGAATSIPYGAGCYDTASATFYELFPPGTFDLQNTGITLLPTGIGYVAMAQAGPWFVPTQTPLTMNDDSISPALPLGFTLNYPGGSTTAIRISSNGFVWAQPGISHGCCGGDPLALRLLGARWCPLWTDLNPTLTGTVRFDTDPTNGAAYVTFTNVPETGVAVPNTFQVAFFATGHVEYRYQQCAILNHTTLTGWSPGNHAADPGSIDLSASLPLVTLPDLHALRMSTNARPIVGTTVTLTANHVPVTSPLGAFLGSIVRHHPGIDLTGLGMPGCRQYVSFDATRVFVPAGTMGTMPFGVPNAASLLGTHVFFQAAAFAIGFNPLGIISSNGLDLRIGTL